MRTTAFALLTVGVSGLRFDAVPDSPFAGHASKAATSFYELSAVDIVGNTKQLSEFANTVSLVVNVATN